jgi:PDZ domain-containing secreted protein
MNATLEVEADLLGTLDASVAAKLNSTAKFEVVSPMAFAVNAEGKNFDVTIASNSSSVTAFAFEQAEKKVSFKVEGETGTKGVAQVTLPKELLAGQLMVSIDGRAVAEDSNDVVVTSDTATEMTLEINYPHSEHTIEISGTSVVPEFPISMIVMTAAIGSVVATIAVASRLKGSSRL